MTDSHHDHDHAPGIIWLAARTGKDPAELRSSPVRAIGDALRELATLAAQTESTEPATREKAEAELRALREEIAEAPRPSEKLLTTVANALRDAAERLKREEG